MEQQQANALSRREIQILCQVAKGLSNQQIGDFYHISRTTVRTHMSHILRKLGAVNRVEATLHALHRGLTTVEECLEPADQILPSC